MERTYKCEWTEITPETFAEIDAIFRDEELMRCMEGLAHPPPPTGRVEDDPPEVKLKRVQEAIDAFSLHPEIFNP